MLECFCPGGFAPTACGSVASAPEPWRHRLRRLYAATTARRPPHRQATGPRLSSCAGMTRVRTFQHSSIPAFGILLLHPALAIGPRAEPGGAEELAGEIGGIVEAEFSGEVDQRHPVGKQAAAWKRMRGPGRHGQSQPAVRRQLRWLIHSSTAPRSTHCSEL